MSRLTKSCLASRTTSSRAWRRLPGWVPPGPKLTMGALRPPRRCLPACLWASPRATAASSPSSG
eukprot:12905929-Prorocentrum_lima.AAC.1